MSIVIKNKQKDTFYGPYKIYGLNPEYTKIIQKSSSSYTIHYRYHQFEYDEISSHLVLSQKILANCRYRSDNFKILSKFLTIEIEFPDDLNEEKLDFYIEIFDTLKPLEVEPEEKHREVSFDDERSSGSGPRTHKLSSNSCQINEIINTNTRSKSPFKRMFQNTQTKRNSVTTLTDSNRGGGNNTYDLNQKEDHYRLPKLILENSILVGGKNSTIKMIPKPHCSGLYLMSMDKGEFQWALPYPPINK